MKILVTGSEGFIGNAFIQKYQKEYQILSLSRNLIENNPNSFAIDLSDGNLSQLPKDIDIIVHLASQQPSSDLIKWEDFYKNNVVSTMRLWEYAKEIQVRKFIYISTTSLFNDSSPKIKLNEDSLASPLTEYGLSKFLTEKLLMIMSKNSDFVTTILRFPSVFGRNQKGGLVKTFYDLAKENKTIDVFNNGQIYRNLLYINDAIGSIERSIKHDNLEKFSIYMIGSSDSIKSKEIVKHIVKFTSSKSDINLIDKPSPVDSDIFIDMAKSIEELKFKPSTIEYGLKCFIDEMKYEI